MKHKLLLISIWIGSTVVSITIMWLVWTFIFWMMEKQT